MNHSHDTLKLARREFLSVAALASCSQLAVGAFAKELPGQRLDAAETIGQIRKADGQAPVEGATWYVVTSEGAGFVYRFAAGALAKAKYLVAFLHANPGHAAGDLGIHADLVMRDDVSARRKHGAARDVTAFRRGPRNFYFRCIRGEHAVGQCDNAQQDDHGDSAQDKTARPRGRFSAAVAQRMIDAKTPQVFVLSIRGSKVRGHC